MKDKREVLRNLTFERGGMNSKIKQAKAEATRELANEYAEKIILANALDEYALRLYLTDFAQAVRDIENM